MSDRPTIGVIGVGWVGLVTATCFAELGHPVVALDVLPEKVESLRRGDVPMHEPGLPELLARNAERLTFTTEMDDVLKAAQLLFCCVDTPPTYSGDADLSRVRAVVAKMPDDGRHALVMKSTVPSGTGASIMREMPSLSYVSCPEFLKEGSAVNDFMKPDRVVVGADAGSEWAAELVEDAYRPLGGEIVRTDVASAEMIKHASNAFLATKISFINEIANVCEATGADVTEVARGMGLDERIGASFLQAGIGYGGSCFVAGSSLLVRWFGTPRLISFEALWELVGGGEEEAIEPEELEAWSWVPGESEPEWMPVAVLTRRAYDGDLVEVRTKMGRRVTVTADHPFIVGDGKDEALLTRMLASELDDRCWLPLASGSGRGFEPRALMTVGAIDDGTIPAGEVIVRPEAEQISALATMPVARRAEVLDHPRGHVQRLGDIKRSGAMRLPEMAAAGLNLGGATLGTARNGTYMPTQISCDERFWRVVGLYLAEGCVSDDSNGRGATRRRISWSFHPTREEHLVEEVIAFWEAHSVKVSVHTAPTARRVSVSSRLIAAWWTETLGLGCNSYEQRLPNLIWEQSFARKRAILSGLWEGDGSWSLVNGGPSAILEWGTVSDTLADGVARLLADLGLICSWRRGRTPKSTKETHWLRLSGADQLERATFLVPERDRAGFKLAIASQSKRIAPTGYRSFAEGGMNWVRVVETKRHSHSGDVFSLEVPGSHTVVVDGGLVASNCFPKDVSSLKQLAGNSGYHFQLLNAVIEVNELQKRRVIGKLDKHLGSLVERRIALLGLAFKPNTDDMREASSLVLSARLQGEGATVVAFDPVAERSAGHLLPSVEMAESPEQALEGADAAILVTEWPQFAELDWSTIAGTMANPLVVDGRNFLDPEVLRHAGFTYEGVGRPSVEELTEAAWLMQALILVGGQGTRLRPLTSDRPKPAITLVDRPFIRFMVDWLGRHGVDRVIMACGFRAEDLRSALGEQTPGGVSISYIEESQPLGTAGPIRHAADEGLLDERFLVLNGDVLTDLDLSAHLRAHAERGALASLALYRVGDPSAYGLVDTAPGGAVEGFLEKPSPEQIEQHDTDLVNAGAYVLERDVVRLIAPGRAVSIERDVFPRLVGQGLYGLQLDGYWMDIGTPERYLQASWDILEGTVQTEVSARLDADGFSLADGTIDERATLAAPALVDRNAHVAEYAFVGPRAVLVEGCRIASEARLSGSVALAGCELGEGATVDGSILAPGVHVGAGASIAKGSVIGAGARVEAGVALAAGHRLEPGKGRRERAPRGDRGGRSVRSPQRRLGPARPPARRAVAGRVDGSA